jgi:putative flippase GtrA
LQRTTAPQQVRGQQPRICGGGHQQFPAERIWTFHSQDPGVGLQFGKFSAVALVGLGLNNGIVYALTERMRLPFYTAKLIATGIVIFWNFGANLLFTFR